MKSSSESHLEVYCRKWNLSTPTHVCDTPSSHIYKVESQNKSAVLKILTDIGIKNEGKSALALQYFKGKGAVQLLNFDEGAHLLEYLPGRHLKELVLEDQDSKATEIIASVLNKLHSHSGSFPGGLISMRKNFRALFEIAADKLADPLFAAGAEVAEKLLSTEKDVRVLHGDVHHKNIMESADRGWIALDPQSLIGERTYDVANSCFNPDDMPSWVETPERMRDTCQIFARDLNLDPERILDFAFAYGCLSSAWCIEDGHDPARRMRITRLIYQLKNEVLK